MAEGYIKISRKILEWEWYGNANTKIVFFHMLLKANWKDTKFEGKVIPRGSFVTSVGKLSAELSMTGDVVRTALRHLLETGEIAKQKTNRYTVITVVNYDLYQGNPEQVPDGTGADAGQDPDRTRTNPRQNPDKSQTNPKQIPNRTQTEPKQIPGKSQANPKQKRGETPADKGKIEDMVRTAPKQNPSQSHSNPKQTPDKSQTEPRQIPNKTQTDPKQIPTIEEYKEFKEYKKGEKEKKESKEKKKRPLSIPPTLEEVREYCEERKNGIDPERFVAFYSSKGWMVGKNRMKDWKMAVVTWEKRQAVDGFGRNGGNGAGSGENDRKYDSREYWGHADEGKEAEWDGW